MDEVLAIIPARGGSKRVPRKNIALLGGKPLIAYSIETALSCPSITRVMVSTEDAEVAEIATRHGAWVPFLRSGDLASDVCSPAGAMVQALDMLADREGYRPDVLVEMYPTSPFRTPAMVEYGLDLLRRGANTVQTVRPVARGSRYYHHATGGPLQRVYSSPPDAPPAFRPYGIFGARRLGARHSFPFRHIPVTDPVMLIDIDYPLDLQLAKLIVKNELFDFNKPGWPPSEAASVPVRAPRPGTIAMSG